MLRRKLDQLIFTFQSFFSLVYLLLIDFSSALSARKKQKQKTRVNQKHSCEYLCVCIVCVVDITQLPMMQLNRACA
jgi:hypothetical protein